MDRTPPLAVRRQLRQEIGFGCPVPGCGSPYLKWHHFDPSWREREHHDPQGMIALCAQHHDKADVGAFTKEQLHQFKREGRSRATEVRGRFDWMRHDLLAVVGGSFYHETPVIVQFRGEPMIWFNRDEDGYLLFNIRMLTRSGEPRLRLEDNFWVTSGSPTDFECPPSGRIIHAKYANGDEIRVEFLELASSAQARERYPHARLDHWTWALPITAVEVEFTVGGTEIHFGPTYAGLPGQNIIQMTASRCACGIAFN